MKTIYILILILFVSSPVFPMQGKYGGQILNINTSARISAMGEANAGLADDLNALTHNPAGLSQLLGVEAQLSHVLYFMDSSLTSVVFEKRFFNFGMGAQIKMFSAEDTYRNSLGYDEQEFKIRYYQYVVGIGKEVGLDHKVGISLNVISENFKLDGLGDYSSDVNGTAASANIGWLYRPNYRDSFGIVLKNVGSTIKLKDEDSPLASSLVAGAGHYFDNFLVSWELMLDRDLDFGWSGGLQLDINGLLLRAGIKYITLSELTMGFGIPVGQWMLDYAFLPHEELGSAHRMTLGVVY